MTAETIDKNRFDSLLEELETRLMYKRELLSDYLTKLAADKQISHTELYKRAQISRQQFSRIIGNETSMPTKRTIFAFAIALKLSIEETEKLLQKAGYALTDNSKLDVIVSFFIEKEIYDFFEINEALYMYDEGLLGSGMKLVTSDVTSLEK